jgi:hypothetical protein
MKKFRIAALAAVLVATGALALQQLDLNLSRSLLALTGGLLVGPVSLLTSDTAINSNRVTRMLSGSGSVTMSPTSTLTCNDSTAIAVVGARVGDPCFHTVPTTHPTAWLISPTWCVVTASDQVKIRMCNATSGTLTPTATTFTVRVISNQ